MPLNLTVSLQPKQRVALETSKISPVTFYGGSKGGGKSHLIRARELLRRLEFPNTKGLIVRKTYPELLSNHIRMFFAEYPPTVGWFNKSEKTIYYPNGSTTEFSYLSSTDDVYTYQGREYEDISIDEITQHEEDVFKILRSSNRTTNRNIRPSMLLTGNPGGVGHGWVKRIFIDRIFKDGENEHDFAFVQARVTDNLALMENDPDYVKRLDDLPDHLRRAYKDGDWDIFAGQVFDFRATKEGNPYHVIDPQQIPSNAIRFISIDWGGNKPVSIGWKAIIDAFTPDGIKFNRIWKYREKYYGDENGIASAEDFKKREKMDFTDVNVAKMIEKESEGEEITYVVGDPSMASQKPRSVTDVGESVMEAMNNYWSKGESGLFIKKGDNNRKTGLNRTRFWLSEAPDGKPYYQIFKSCKDTIRTYPTLIYEDGKDDVDTTIEDHCLTYDTECVTLLGRQKIGDLVGTFGWVKTVGNYWTRYSHCRKTRSLAKIVEIVFIDGSRVKSTPDHRFLCADGISRPASEIKGKICYQSPSYQQKYKNLTERDIISVESIIKKTGIGYIDRFIKKFMGRYPIIATFTTKTGIDTIINKKTFLLLIRDFTYHFTQRIKTIKIGLRQCTREQKSGTDQPRGKSGIQNMRKEPGTIGRLLRKHAYIAKRNTQLITTNRNTATTTASPLIVVEVLERPNEDVYCLVADLTHVFVLTNGAVVSNCYDEDRYGFMSRPFGAVDEKEKESKDTYNTFDYHLDRQKRKRIDASIDVM